MFAYGEVVAGIVLLGALVWLVALPCFRVLGKLGLRGRTTLLTQLTREEEAAQDAKPEQAGQDDVQPRG